jgi:hypothetical protein
MRERERNKQDSLFFLFFSSRRKSLQRRCDVMGKKRDERPKQPIKPLDNKKGVSIER